MKGLSDVKTIAEIAHKYGALLIVDEAHGAHMPYHESFPVSALYQGADIVVQSLHKTLPSLNQTALVFVNGDEELARKVQRALSVFTTTSPSYGLLAASNTAWNGAWKMRKNLMNMWRCCKHSGNAMRSLQPRLFGEK